MILDRVQELGLHAGWKVAIDISHLQGALRYLYSFTRERDLAPTSVHCQSETRIDQCWMTLYFYEEPLAPVLKDKLKLPGLHFHT